MSADPRTPSPANLSRRPSIAGRAEGLSRFRQRLSSGAPPTGRGASRLGDNFGGETRLLYQKRMQSRGQSRAAIGILGKGGHDARRDRMPPLSRRPPPSLLTRLGERGSSRGRDQKSSANGADSFEHWALPSTQYLYVPPSENWLRVKLPSNAFDSTNTYE